jgi:hypothetical protein
MSTNNTIISILLPTRGRTTMLKSSIESLLKTANNTKRLEFILGLDDDDATTLEYVKSEVAALMLPYQVESRAQIFKPLGYENLHVYVNTLAGSARGEWMFFWNDDAVMQTQGWDDVIASHTGEFKLLGPRDNHAGHPYAIFPIVPKDWFILMDHLSQNAQNDAWLSHIAYMLDIFERIPVDVIHDRADITGNNNDETFQNRKYMEGNPSDPKDFGHSAQQQARVASAYKIAWYLDKIGQPSTWWREVTAGKRNPFEKMVWAPGVKGAGQLEAVDQGNAPVPPTENKKKFTDDLKIVL